MIMQSLAGAWEFRQVKSEEWLPASVPGGVHTDLLALGRIPDPFLGDNEKRVQWVAESDWTYRRVFTCPMDLIARDKIFLVCDGLDTLATVILNGQELGSTNNMFRHYEWEVGTLLNSSSDNELIVKITSPVKYTAEKHAIRPLAGVTQAIPGSPHLRKAPCQFGWDWGPQLPPIGIWKDIRLESFSTARLSNVHLQQQHDSGNVTVAARLDFERWEEKSLSAVVKIKTPDDKVLETESPVPWHSLMSGP